VSWPQIALLALLVLLGAGGLGWRWHRGDVPPCLAVGGGGGGKELEVTVSSSAC